MNTKQFIELLNQVDPAGTTEISINNCTIFHIEKLPAYYDGRLQKIKKVDDKYICDVVGSGDKVLIKYYSILDLALDFPIQINCEFKQDQNYYDKELRNLLEL